MLFNKTREEEIATDGLSAVTDFPEVECFERPHLDVHAYFSQETSPVQLGGMWRKTPYREVNGTLFAPDYFKQ